MAKIRVHELAKSLNKPSKEIIAILEANHISVKNHMSSLEEAHVAVVKKIVGGMSDTEAASQAKPVSAAPAKARSEAGTEHKAEKKEKPDKAQREDKGRKKENITQVYNPHNSSNPHKKSLNNKEKGSSPLAKPVKKKTERANENDKAHSRPGEEQAKPVQNGHGKPNQGNGNNHTKPGQGNNKNNKPAQGNNRQNQNNSKQSQNNSKQNQGNSKQNQSNNRQNQNNNRQNQNNNRQNQKNNKQQNRNRRNQPNQQPVPQPKKEPEEETIKTIILPESLTISELADKMKIKPSELVKKLFLQGKMVTVNQDVDFDTAEEIKEKYGIDDDNNGRYEDSNR